MKSIAKYIGMLVLTMTIFNCSKDDGTTVVPNPVQELPVPEVPEARLIDIAPKNGPKETLVSITGEHFGNNADSLRVFFNDKEATIETVSDTKITATVPPKAFSGNVKVIVGETELIGSKFVYEITDIQVTTIAGSTGGYADGSGKNAQFRAPRDIAVDAVGNLFVADHKNDRIRKITPSGVVSTFAGGGVGDEDGTDENMKFKQPSGIDIDKNGHLFITDAFNNKISKITPDGAITTLAGSVEGDADGLGEIARLHRPTKIVVGPDGTAYFSDTNNKKLRKVTAEGQVSTIAGSIPGDDDGVGENASFNSPEGVSLDKDGNLYIADRGNNRIRKITPSGVVSTLTGNRSGSADGPIEIATFREPRGVAIDIDGIIYIADTGNNRIRKITPDGMVSTIAGGTTGTTDGPGADAQFDFPTGLVVDDERTIYVVDSNSHRIRKITQE